MHKANVTVLLVIILAVAGLIAAEWYYFDYRPRAAEAALDGLGPDPTLPETSNLSGDTSKIIQCEDAQGETFYSDADSCEEAEPPESDATPPDLPEN